MAALRPEGTMSVRETAEILSVSHETVYRRVRAGDLDAGKTGWRTWVTEESLRRYIEASRVAAAPGLELLAGVRKWHADGLRGRQIDRAAGLPQKQFGPSGSA